MQAKPEMGGLWYHGNVLYQPNLGLEQINMGNNGEEPVITY